VHLPQAGYLGRSAGPASKRTDALTKVLPSSKTWPRGKTMPLSISRRVDVDPFYSN
jgi:hypothetical protein